jgi:hypothetical protein
VQQRRRRDDPSGQHVHAVVDNDATHKHPKVRNRGLFAKLTKRRLARGVLRSVEELKTAIERCLAETNIDPRPFIGKKKPATILAAVKRGHQMLDSNPRLSALIPTAQQYRHCHAQLQKKRNQPRRHKGHEASTKKKIIPKRTFQNL